MFDWDFPGQNKVHVANQGVAAARANKQNSG